MKKLNKKVLLFIKIPPPITGTTIMNSYVYKSQLLNRHFKLQSILVSYKVKIEDKKILSINKIFAILINYFKLIKEIINFRPYLVYFQLSPVGIAFFRDLTFILIIKSFKIKILYHIHGKGINKYISESRIKKWIYFWVFNKSYVICLANNLVFDLKKIYQGVPYVVNNGIPIFEYTKPIKVEKRYVNILFFSHLLYSKGILDYLDAIVILKGKGIKNFKAYIAGKEAELTEEILRTELIKKGLTDSVTYLGPKFDKDKTEVFVNSDIFVYPSLNDAFPLVILEAMQASLPIIASREGAIPEIIDDGITGFLVDINNPGHISEKINTLINDPNLREKIGLAGREKFLAHYTLDIFEKQMKRVFEEILRKIS